MDSSVVAPAPPFPVRGRFFIGVGWVPDRSPVVSQHGLKPVPGTTARSRGEQSAAEWRQTGQEVQTMLVITRREGEEVVIGNPAAPLGIVRIATIKGDRVRIAFEFPREVDVHRREVADQILATDPARNVLGKIRPAGEQGAG